MSKLKNIGLWAAAFILMSAVAVYQRVTGPTQPQEGTITFYGHQVGYKFLRSENCGINAPISIYAPKGCVSAELILKRYKSNDTLMTRDFCRIGDSLTAYIPHQPAAGKVMYRVKLIDTVEHKSGFITNSPVIIRYKGKVPDVVLIIHILLMFASMLVAARTGFEAMRKSESTYKYCIWTVILMFLGGFVMGPIVQHFAFGVYWSGWPFGRDMTDNKTIFSFLMWLVALYQMKSDRKSYNWVIIAFVVMMAAYLIPHSVFGSELDYTKMPVK